MEIFKLNNLFTGVHLWSSL